METMLIGEMGEMGQFFQHFLPSPSMLTVSNIQYLQTTILDISY